MASLEVSISLSAITGSGADCMEDGVSARVSSCEIPNYIHYLTDYYSILTMKFTGGGLRWGGKVCFNHHKTFF